MFNFAKNLACVAGRRAREGKGGIGLPATQATKNWAKSFGNGTQDICKANVSNFGTIRWLVRLKLSRNKSLFAIRAAAHVE